MKKDKSGIPRSDAIYDSGHEPSNEEELTTYQTLFGMHEETLGAADPPSTSHPTHPSTSHPLPPPPPAEPAVTSPSPTLEDQVQDLTTRRDAFWDETQEHPITMSQDMDALQVDMRIVLRNQQVIQQQLAQLLALHVPPPPQPPH